MSSPGLTPTALEFLEAYNISFVEELLDFSSPRPQPLAWLRALEAMAPVTSSVPCSPPPQPSFTDSGGQRSAVSPVGHHLLPCFTHFAQLVRIWVFLNHQFLWRYLPDPGPGPGSGFDTSLHPSHLLSAMTRRVLVGAHGAHVNSFTIAVVSSPFCVVPRHQPLPPLPDCLCPLVDLINSWSFPLAHMSSDA